jgi:arylsulfatase
VATAAALFASVASAQAQQAGTPKVLVIWGDDIGVHNIGAYNHAIMGYRTPRIDPIAREGALLTDAYGEQSCTAGRAAFMLGQHPFRTGMPPWACRDRRTASQTGRRASPT